MSSLFDVVGDTPRTLVLADPASGLRAFVCLDDDTLGPFVGGIRTRGYRDELDALSDARHLARAMTVKCALAGLDAGGGKTVVLDHASMNREAAFEVLGQRIEELGGRYQCAGDLGTGPADLAAVGRHTAHVHTNERDLAAAVGRSVRIGAEAAAAVRGVALADCTVAIQGAGAIGAAAARALHAAGASIRIADLDPGLAARVAAEVEGETLRADAVLRADVDVLVPCAVGGAVGMEEVAELRAWALVPGANNTLRDDDTAVALVGRRVLHVPDALASAGAVMEGIGRRVMGLDDLDPLFARLRDTADTVLRRSAEERRSSDAIARELAWQRIGRG